VVIRNPACGPSNIVATRRGFSPAQIVEKSVDVEVHLGAKLMPDSLDFCDRVRNHQTPPIVALEYRWWGERNPPPE
jgi:hypothetical protein